MAATATVAAPSPVAPVSPDYGAMNVHSLRSDLIISEQVYLGRAYVIVKNPINLTYFRLSRAHFAAARCFDGQAKLSDIARHMQDTSKYWRALSLESAVEELYHLGMQLNSSGVLQTSGQQALGRMTHMQARRRKFGVEALVGSILYIKKSLVDPNRLLLRMDRYFGWMYTRGYVVSFCAAAVVTILMLAGHREEIAERAANFFTLQNLMITWVVFIFVKTIHEFGHGLTCRHYGGEVHEMGALFIMFTPYLYCNVSDSWILPDKKRRILVTAAGIFVEMSLAIIAAWVWLLTTPGLLHQVCFNIMFTCSVTTVLFNANPLLKFDGYYMLSDALEVPNLKQKSTVAATTWAQRYLLGIRFAGPAQFFSYELSPLFGFYAVASYLYGWLVLYRISTHFFDALAPYGLDFLSRSYVWLYLFTALALPCYRLMKVTYQNPSTRAAAARRFAQIGTAAALFVGAAWFIPWHDSVKRGAVLDHAMVEPILARSAGFLREVYVKDGEKVRAGQPIARLENRELEEEIDELRREGAGYEVQRRAALSERLDAMRDTATAYARLVEATRLQLELRQWQLNECTLRATRDGIIRQQNLDKTIGQYFPRGREFCEVGSSDEYRAIVSLDESQARRVTIGQTAFLRLRALSDRTFEGKITSAPISSLTRLSNLASANIGGGDVPSQPSKDGGLEPSVAYYEAEMLVRDDPNNEHLHAGLNGKVRIETGRTTLGRYLWSSLLDLVNPAMRL